MSANNQTHKAQPIMAVLPDEGAAKARQSVAQSTAMAVQDATDSLRNLSSISATAIGVSLAQYIQTGDDRFLTAIEKSEKVADNAANRFQNVGQRASDILSLFANDNGLTH